jgi:hypothetical protein
MVAPTCFGITLPSSGSVPSAFWKMPNWGAVDRILRMGVLFLMTSDRHAPRHVNRTPGGEIFRAFRTGSEDHPASCRKGTASFPGVQRPERGFDHTLLLSGFEYIRTIISPSPFCACIGMPWSDLYLYFTENLSSACSPAWWRCISSGLSKTVPGHFFLSALNSQILQRHCLPLSCWDITSRFLYNWRGWYWNFWKEMRTEWI